jgi:hypothetical protein
MINVSVLLASGNNHSSCKDYTFERSYIDGSLFQFASFAGLIHGGQNCPST